MHILKGELVKNWLFIILAFNLNSMVYAEFLPQSFEAQFEQEYISTLKSKVKKGKGLIKYKYPGQIRFETDTPSTVIYVTNGKKSWYYRAPFVPDEQGEVTISSAKSGSTPYTKFFDVLKNGLKSNDFYDYKDGEKSRLTFKPAYEKEFGIKKAEISFATKTSKLFKDITDIELTFSDDKTSKIKFKELKIDSVNAADSFEFEPPANTKVTN